MTALRGVVLLCFAATMALATDTRALYEVIDGSNHFSNHFFEAVGKEKKGNLVASPLSASLILSLTAYGAAGKTRKEMDAVLHLPRDDSVRRAGFQSLIDSFANVEGVEIRIANKIFTQDGYLVKEQFQQVATDVFRSSTQSVNFADSDAAVKIVNNWCEEQTNNRITDLLKPSDVNPLTRIVLANAVYFKGSWENAFSVNDTQNRPFHVSRDVVKNVPTMLRTGTYNYGVVPELKSRFVELPYKNQNFSLVIILPDEIEGLKTLEEKLVNHDLVNIIRKGRKTEVTLLLPKFKIESGIELNDILKQMGLKEMFDERKADFSALTDEPVVVSTVIQKAFLEVNEEGSEAAASTGVQIGLKGARWRYPVLVDHPFLAVLLYNDVEVFVARVQNP